MIITRFSLDSKITFDVAPDRDKLYADGRMERRFHFFEHIYLPGLQAMFQATPEKENLAVALLYSPNMPKKYLSRLKTLVKPYSRIHLLETRPRDDFSLNAHFAHLFFTGPSVAQIKVATVLLDDDDALHPSFVSRLREIMPTCKKTTLVSFSRGCTVDLARGKAEVHCKLALVSAGLTFIFDWRPNGSSSRTEKHNVYHKKNTYQLDRPLKIVFVDGDSAGTPLMYLMTNHDSNLSHRGVWMKLSATLDEEIKQCFPFLGKTRLGLVLK